MFCQLFEAQRNWQCAFAGSIADQQLPCIIVDHCSQAAGHCAGEQCQDDTVVRVQSSEPALNCHSMGEYTLNLKLFVCKTQL
jgi:hypothetical protein